jgi:hypothetical protein
MFEDYIHMFVFAIHVGFIVVINLTKVVIKENRNPDEMLLNC